MLRKESGLSADVTHVTESELLGMFATADRSAIDRVSGVERDWINQDLKSRVRATEPRFGIDMVPETDELGYLL